VRRKGLDLDMAKGQLFKTSLFGLSKKSVYTYLSMLNKKLEEELQAKDAVISNLRMQNANQVAPAVNYSGADEIVENAHRQAEAVLANAHQSLKEQKEKLKNDIKNEKMKLRLLQAEVEGLKRKAVELTEKFTNQIDDLIENEV